MCPGCSNRTFMELKYSLLAALNLFSFSSNRTFMELKFHCLMQYRSRDSPVLIVPLWN